jgi:hypothetical protein
MAHGEKEEPWPDQAKNSMEHRYIIMPLEVGGALRFRFEA